MIYTLLISIFKKILPVLAVFNKSLAKFYKGRQNLFEHLEQNTSHLSSPIWIHAASLGEYEQAVPIIEYLKRQQHEVVVSFFSPSGYDIKHDDKRLDATTYLPIDTPTDMNRFMQILKPKMAIIIKYEVWPHMMKAIREFKIPSILVSAQFSRNQIYFKSYGGLFLKALNSFDHCFVQTEASLNMAKKLGLRSVIISGDTRFDRVYQQLSYDNRISELDAFVDEQACLVFGSTWPEDEKLLIDYINKSSQNTKIIIAPHKVDQPHIEAIVDAITVSKTTWTNLKKSKDKKRSQVLVVDCIGLLTKIYSYAEVAYVGGAMGKTGLHNILEPATFGVPVLFGCNHQKFPEAEALINANAAFDVANANDLKHKLDQLLEDPKLRKKMGHNASQYIVEHKGATHQVCQYISRKLKPLQPD